MAAARWAVCALAVLSACSRDAKPAPRETAAHAQKQVAAPTPVAEEAQEPDIVITPKPGRITVRSTIPGYNMIATDTLPRIEQIRKSVAMCDEWGEIIPETPGGKAAKALGWRVTDERPIGRLTAVTILRRYESWAGLPCMPVTSNIVFFDAATVVAMLHPASDPVFIPAALEPMKDGALRVWTTMPAPPVGDLRLSGNTLSLSGTAPVDTVCDGQVHMPNLFRKPIAIARAILMKEGWKPYRPNGPIDRETDGSEYFEYYRKGITEIDHCAGDSVGQCLFYYRSRRGTLRVETGYLDESDLQGVINYELNCPDKSGRLKPAPWETRGGSYY